MCPPPHLTFSREATMPVLTESPIPGSFQLYVVISPEGGHKFAVGTVVRCIGSDGGQHPIYRFTSDIQDLSSRDVNCWWVPLASLVKYEYQNVNGDD